MAGNLLVAEIVSVGTELLMGQIVDSNAQHLGRLLPEVGIAHHHRQTVGDNLRRLTEALRLALFRSDLVFTIGGLGPTLDDLTREGIAAALDAPLQEDPQYLDKLRKLWAIRDLPWTEAQARQAMKPEGSRLIENPNGSAPGLICESEGKVVIALPGPRGEFEPMVEGPVREYLLERSAGEVIHSRILRICAMGESLVEERLRDLMDGVNPTMAPYAKPGEVHLRLSARARNAVEADILLEPIEREVRSRLGWVVFGQDDETLEAACLSGLLERGLTLATAESMTGGGVGSRITNVEGAGKSFRGGVVAYEPEIKTRLLGVSAELLKEHGPVSAACASAMAEGARGALLADVAISVTGNAGPDSDIDGKPVGLIYVGLATPEGVATEEHRFRATRAMNRERATQAALTLLYRWLRGELPQHDQR